MSKTLGPESFEIEYLLLSALPVFFTSELSVNKYETIDPLSGKKKAAFRMKKIQESTNGDVTYKVIFNKELLEKYRIEMINKTIKENYGRDVN